MPDVIGAVKDNWKIITGGLATCFTGILWIGRTGGNIASINEKITKIEKKIEGQLPKSDCEKYRESLKNEIDKELNHGTKKFDDIIATIKEDRKLFIDSLEKERDKNEIHRKEVMMVLLKLQVDSRKEDINGS